MPLRSQFLLLLVSLLCFTRPVHSAWYPISSPYTSPTIAIVTTPSVNCGPPPPNIITNSPDGQCVNGLYISWLQPAGIRIVPLHWDASPQDQDKILDQVNGVLFPGGSLDESPVVYEQYFRNAQRIWNYAAQKNSQGDPFLVWGTCQGFQVLSAVTAGNLSAISNWAFNGTSWKMLPLDFTAQASTSRFLGNSNDMNNGNSGFLSPAILEGMQNYPTTLNMHHDGVRPEKFADGTLPGGNWTVLTTNKDLLGNEFVSTIEAKNNMNAFAIQWHAEWPAFAWNTNQITHTNWTFAVSTYTSHFVYSRLILNNHQWTSASELEASVIDNAPMSYDGYGYRYYWPGAAYTGSVNSNGNSSSGGDGSSGAIVGAALGCLVVGVLIGAAGHYYAVKRKSHDSYGNVV